MQISLKISSELRRSSLKGR